MMSIKGILLVFSILAVVIAMISIQSGASVAKELFPRVGPQGATVMRLVVAATMLCLIWRPWRKKITHQEKISVAIYGASLGIMNLTFYMALERIPLGIAVALEFTGPLALALLTSRNKLDFCWALLAIIGMGLILPVTKVSAPLDPVGVMYALSAGACWAFYILFGKKASATVHGGVASSLGMLMAALVVLPFGIMNARGNLLALDILPLGLVVGVLSSAFPYTLEMYALKNIPTQTFGILMSLEPAIAALSGLFFLGERLLFIQWLAILCIMLASLGSSLKSQAPMPAAA